MRRWNHSDHGYLHFASVVLAVLFKSILKLHETQPFSNFAVAIWFGPIICERAGHEICESQTWKCDEGSYVTWRNMPPIGPIGPMCDYVSDIFRWKIEQLGNSLSKGPFARVFN